jgi:hypothetical protein
MSSLALAQAPTDVPTAPLDLAPAQPPASPAPAPAPAPPSPPPPAPAPGETITAQVGTRATFRIQSSISRNKLNDVSSDGEADALVWGQVHPFLKWQAGFIGTYGGPGSTSHADLLDLVAKVEIVDAFNLWIGRMPMPSDRTSLSTVWALPTWTPPGVYSNYPLPPSTSPRPWPGPRYGDLGRGDGVTFWGQLRGGRFKYYAGVFDLNQPRPLYSGRLGFCLLGHEPGYRNSSGYYGGQNLLALGIGGQHQAAGSSPAADSGLPASNFNEVNGDLLFEINRGAAGILDVEGALAKTWGENELGSYQVMGLASYLVPIVIGIGRFQPLVRFQHAGAGKAVDASDFTGIDAQLGYIVDGFHARLLAVYQYAKLQHRTENAILFGLQLLSPTK